MPLIPLAFLFVLAVIALVPLSLAMRFRAGVARRRGRPWLAAVNLAMICLSAVLFLVTAAISSIWLLDVFRYSMLGLAAGSILGLLGLSLTRWEKNRDALYYTPNRQLAILITAGVAIRLLYSLWRTLHPSTTAAVPSGSPSAAATSFAAGAALIGYYLVYATGICYRTIQHRK